MAGPAPAAAPTCANHPKRERVATCGTCGNALCRDCVVHTGVGIKCRTCTGEAAPAAATSPGSRPRWVVPAAIAGAVVLVAGVLLLRSGGGGGERPVAQEPDNDPSRSSVPVERKVDLVGGGNVRLGATLMLPGGGQPKAGVLIIPGFGAIDRDAVMATSPDASADRLSQDLNYSRPGSPDKLLADLSNSFLAENMATLRYDKRGSGASQLRADQPLSYDDLVADAKAGLDFLAQRVEVGSAPLAIVGDDQGGLIALRLAASNPRVKAVMLVSTFSRPLADVIGDDLVAGRGEAGGRPQSDQLHDVAAKLAAGQHVPAPAELLGNLRPLLLAGQEGYLRTIFGLDPLAEAKAVTVPVRLVRGAKDTTVTAADAGRFASALPAGSFSEQVVADADHNLGMNGVRSAAALGDIGSWLATAVAR